MIIGIGRASGVGVLFLRISALGGTEPPGEQEMDFRLFDSDNHYSDRPSDVFKDRFFVSPFPEDDIPALVDVLGADHVLMGSDWPHAEGTATPGAPAPIGTAAVQLWDAIQVLSEQPGFFEITRPRSNPPRPADLD